MELGEVLAFVEFQASRSQGRSGWWGLARQAVGLVRARSKGEGPMVEHLLSQTGCGCGCLDAEVAEHGVGVPAAEEADDVRVYLGAEEGGCAPWAERPSGEELGVDACGGGY